MKDFKHMKFLNKNTIVKDGKLVIDMGKGIYKDVPVSDYYASTKFDGFLCGIIEGVIMSSSNKTDSFNPLIREHLKEIIEYSRVNNLILIGEVFSSEIEFSEFSGIMKSTKTIKEIPSHFKFHCFDCITNRNYDEVFESRLANIPETGSLNNLVKVEQKLINSTNAQEFLDLFNKNLDEGNEGLIIKNKLGRYKNGRTSPTEAIGYKFKEFITEDVEIIGINQATEVDEGIEKTTNELGRSVTSKKKEDRHGIDKACSFQVMWHGIECTCPLSGDDTFKKDVWNNQEKYIGEFVEMKYMGVGLQNKPRIPSMLRMRFKADDE